MHRQRVLLASKTGSKSEKGFEALRKHVRTNERTEATDVTNASKTSADNLAFLNVREGLWITPFSRAEVAS